MSDPIDTGALAASSGLKPGYSLKSAQKREKSLETYSQAELIALRDEIDALLPPLDLKSFNAAQEVMLQYQRLKALQAEVNTMVGGEGDASVPGTPANQRAQVANSVARALGEIVRLRNEIYNSEQFRLMEASLAKCLKTLPKEAQDVFFVQYGKTVEDMARVID